MVPKGYTRFMGRIAELTDRGIPFHFSPVTMLFGCSTTLSKSSGRDSPQATRKGNDMATRCCWRMATALGRENWYKLPKRIFTSATLQWLFARLHPNSHFGLETSGALAAATQRDTHVFRGDDEQITAYPGRF